MAVAEQTANLSYCNRLKVGCIVVDDSGTNILSYGYNGTPYGFENCCEDDNNITKDNVIHAEMNALLKLARDGHSGKDGYIFVTHSPCEKCSASIIQAGISKVYYKHEYRCSKSFDMFKQAGIDVVKV